MRERYNFEINLLKSIFVSSSENGKVLIPKRRGYLLGTLASGVLEHIGILEIIRERDFKSEKKIEIFHRNLDNRLQWLIRSDYLDQDISETLYELMHSYQENPPFGSYNTSLYNILENEIEKRFFQSYNGETYSMLQEFISQIKEDIIPTFSEEQQRDILGIGNCMRKYIVEDLEYLSCKI